MKRLLFLAVLLASFFAVSAQDRYAVLKDEKVATVPNGYHISGVIDDRDDKSSIGDITYADGKKGKLILRDGAMGLRAFIVKNVTQDMSTKPVFLHIKQFDMDIKNDGSQWVINTNATFVFYASGYKLIEFSDKGQAEVSGDPEVYAEEHIRKMTDNVLKSFNDWWPENGGKISTSEGAVVNVILAKTTDRPDAIVYSMNRLLQIADFTGPSQATGNEMAATLSGSTMSMTGSVENGQTVINVVVTPYFDTRGSWFKEEGKNPAVLAHEQAHFDITAIKACELVQNIKAAKFTRDNYEQLLSQLEKQNTAAAYDEENQYDNETNHGIIKDKQAEWEKKLKEQVSATGCYN